MRPDDLTKESAGIKEVFQENSYHESIISKILKRITNNLSLSQSQQPTQAKDIQEDEITMSINLQYAEGASEKLWSLVGSYKIRPTFLTEDTFRKLLCKPKDSVATKGKNSIVYEIDYSNCEVVYIQESKPLFKITFT